MKINQQYKKCIIILINNFFFIINTILWFFNINSLSELITGITISDNQTIKLIYGLCSLLQYICYVAIIELIITIYWWAKNNLSIAERISGLKQS